MTNHVVWSRQERDLATPRTQPTAIRPFYAPCWLYMWVVNLTPCRSTASGAHDHSTTARPTGAARRLQRPV